MKQMILLTIAFLSAAAAAETDNAKANWQIYCAKCHGQRGQGNTRMGRYLGAPNYQQAKVQASFTDEQAFKSIKEGIVKDDRRKMKSFAGELTDQDIRDLVHYIRTLQTSK